MSGFSQVDVEIGYSPTLVLAISIVNLSAVIAIAMTHIPVILILLMVALLLVYHHLILKSILNGHQEIIHLSCFPDDHEWYAQDRSEKNYIISKVCHLSIFKGCLLLKLEDVHNKSHWLIVVKDSVSPNTFRRLNVLLQYHLPLQHPASKSSEV